MSVVLRPTVLMVKGDTAQTLILEEAGYQVRGAKESDILSAAEGADVVILNSPVSPGAGLHKAQLLKSVPKTQNVPVVVVADATHDDVAHAHHYGVSGVLCAPYEPEDLVSIVRRAHHAIPAD